MNTKQLIFACLVALMLFSLIACDIDETPMEVNFADENLEAAIREYLDKPSEPILVFEVEEISRLDLSRRGIISLEGIEQLPGLTRLDLSGNELVDISPLAHLTEMKTLDLMHCKISDISPLSGLVEMRNLDLRHNQIDDISAVADMVQLVSLDLRDNLVADIFTLAGLTDLIELDLRENQVVDVTPLAGLINLESLNLRRNQVVDISSLGGLANLRELNFRDNQVVDISALSNLVLLEDLNCRNNQIYDLYPLAELEHLTKRLYIDGNKIKDYRPLIRYYNDILDKDFEIIPTEPDFSIWGGYFNEEFMLTLTAQSPDAKIYYTLDGSVPDLAKNARNTFEYTKPIAIKSRKGDRNTISTIPTTKHYWPGPPKGEVFKATVVRARAYYDGVPAEETQVITHTYFVHPDMTERYSMPIVSISTDPGNFFDDKYGIYVPGARYQDGNIRTGNFYGRGVNWERDIHIEFYEPDGRLGFSQDAGVRIHGGITRYWPLKTLRIYARSEYGTSSFEHQLFPDQHYDEYKRFLLRQSGNDMRRTFFRDALIQSLFTDTNVDTQAYRPVIVFLNGEYWGIHNMRERYDQHYLARVYGVDEEDVVIIAHHGVLDTGKSGDTRHYWDMLRFIQKNDLSKKANYEYVKTLIDIDNHIDYMIAEIYCANTDWPFNNMKYWRIRTDEYIPDAPYGHDGRYRWLLYDTDYGLGLAQTSTIDHNTLGWAASSGTSISSVTFLFANLLKNQEYREKFINRFADHLNTNLLPHAIIERIDDMQAVLAPEYGEHLRRWNYITITSWHRYINDMKTWVKGRPAHVRRHIIDRFKLGGTAELTIASSHEDAGIIRINTINLPAARSPWRGIYFQGVPIQISAEASPGYQFVGWSGDITSTDSLQILNPKGNLRLTAEFVSLVPDPGEKAK